MISFLAILASGMSLAAGFWYNRDLFRGATKPNLSSWAVWTFITILSSTSYFVASSDLLKSLIAFSNSTVTVVTFILILWRGRFSRIAGADIAAGALGMGAALVWYLTQSAIWGNVILQGAILIGSIPTFRSVWIDPASERPGPWLLWTLSFVVAAGVVVLRWNGHPLELAYSAAGLIVYGGIGMLALRKKA